MLDENDGDDDLETIELDVPIDEIHRQQYEQISEIDVDVNTIIAQHVQADVEGAIHEIFQAIKFNETE